MQFLLYLLVNAISSSFWQKTSRSFRLMYWEKRLRSFGEDSHVYPNVIIHSPQLVDIGNRVNIAEFVHIWGGGGVQIGDNTIIASHVVITSQTHDKNSRIFRDSLITKPVTIKENCWIGAGAVILPDVTIGKNSIIGAQAVVNRDVEPNSIMVGIPAQKINCVG